MAVFRPGTNRLWAAFIVIFLLAAIGADIYWLISESGPVRWLALMQAKLLGGRWVPKLTFLVLLLAEILPILLLKVLIERVTGTRLTAPPETPPSNPQPR